MLPLQLVFSRLRVTVSVFIPALTLIPISLLPVISALLIAIATSLESFILLIPLVFVSLTACVALFLSIVTRVGLGRGVWFLVRAFHSLHGLSLIFHGVDQVSFLGLGRVFHTLN
mmetsp:Transcript_19460/g.24016  ORF Transcript_19460/g.24016 Transcript_19460/m.24016 type:complete len:115 (-) Transcript_19460:568-912(-)